MAAARRSAVPPPASREPVGGVALVLVAGRTLTHGDVDALLRRVRDRIADVPGRRVLCDVRAVVAPDIETVDALARLALRVHRLGCELQLLRASPRLEELLCLAGLDDVVPCLTESVVEARGQAEQREEPGGVEKERDPADAPP